MVETPKFRGIDDTYKALQELKRNEATLKEFGKIKAAIQRSNFEEYIAQGFTPEQALELTKSVFN